MNNNIHAGAHIAKAAGICTEMLSQYMVKIVVYNLRGVLLVIY